MPVEAQVFRLIHHTHATRSKFSKDLVMRNSSPDQRNVTRGRMTTMLRQNAEKAIRELLLNAQPFVRLALLLFLLDLRDLVYTALMAAAGERSIDESVHNLERICFADDARTERQNV